MARGDDDRWRAVLSDVTAHVSAASRRSIRSLSSSLSSRLGSRLGNDERRWWTAAAAPWQTMTPEELAAPAFCNICRWTGERFDGTSHVESATCPCCGAIARDRYLVWCFMQRTPSPAGARVLETSPRLDDPYRRYMKQWFDYRASDFDLRAHVADVQLDLQDITLPTASVDIVLTPHVLEHVPDTGRALCELFRVIAPGGRMYLQVPLLHGQTAVPLTPEFHADNTPVHFNFGWDLTDAARAAGFEVDVLVTSEFRSWLAGEKPSPGSTGDEFSIESLLRHVRVDDLTSIANDAQAGQLGFLPPYQFVTWECRRP
jgi:SAM-dependent methyltransferase